VVWMVKDSGAKIERRRLPSDGLGNVTSVPSSPSSRVPLLAGINRLMPITLPHLIHQAGLPAKVPSLFGQRVGLWPPAD
jgi:hypothetical protein